MERLKRRYPDSDKLIIVAPQETKLLLLLDDRHVVFEKTNIAFINQKNISTELEELTPGDVVRLVRPFVSDFFADDIGTIEKDGDCFNITLPRYCTVYHGTFKIIYSAKGNL